MHGQGILPAGLDWNAPVAAIGQTAHSFLRQVEDSRVAFILQHSLELHAYTAARGVWSVHMKSSAP